jgi:hypothetical protein
MDQRHIVLHYHLFKNAGSTVDAILRRSFGESAWMGIEGDRLRGVLPAARVHEAVVANPRIRAVSSHQARLPVPVARGIAFYPIVFLRHPIDRARSVYAFERGLPADVSSPGAVAARKHDFAGYVRWRLAPGNGCVIRDFQTVHLSSAFDDMGDAVATATHLRTAIERLAGLEFCGLVERFDASLQWMSRYLRPWFGVLDIRHPPLNVSPGRAETLEARLRDIEYELGPDLYQRLLEVNRLDSELHAAASARFDEMQDHCRGAGSA